MQTALQLVLVNKDRQECVIQLYTHTHIHTHNRLRPRKKIRSFHSLWADWKKEIKKENSPDCLVTECIFCYSCHFTCRRYTGHARGEVGCITLTGARITHGTHSRSLSLCPHIQSLLFVLCILFFFFQICCVNSHPMERTAWIHTIITSNSALAFPKVENITLLQCFDTNTLYHLK